jgi:membrane protease YdiL (CAAX protease family)
MDGDIHSTFRSIPMSKRPVLNFLLLAFSISWGIFAVAKWGIGVSSTIGWTLTSSLFMFGPALAALAFRRDHGVSWKDLGVKRTGIRWKWIGFAVLIAMALPPLTLAFNWLLGDVFQINGFGHSSLTKDMVLNTVREKLVAAGVGPTEMGSTMERLGSMPLNGVAILMIALIAGAIAGCTVNFLFAMGEELGWRGLLFHHTRRWGLWKHVGFTGVFWGLWHAPLILEGHNYPDHPVAGVFFMCVLTTALALPLAWVRFRSGCVWSAGVLHGTVNGVAGAGMLFTRDGSSLLGGAVGVSAVLGLAIIGGLLFIFDPSLRREFNPG